MKRNLICWVLVLLVLVSGGAAAAESKTEYMAVFMDGKKIGHAIETRCVADGKVTTSTKTNLTINRGGVAMEVNGIETSVESIDGKVISFENSQSASGVIMSVKGLINDKGQLDVTMNMAGNIQEKTIDWPEGALMSEGLRRLQLEKGLKEGTSYSAAVFEPGMLLALAGEIDVGSKKMVDLLGRVVELTEVQVTLRVPGTALTVTTYVDDELNALKAVVPMAGMTLEMVACEKSFALSDNDVVDFLEKLLLESPSPLQSVGSGGSVTYQLSPTGANKLSIPASDVQSVQNYPNGSAVITVKPIALPKGAAFPYAGKDKIALEAIKSNRYLQSDHPKIVEMTRKAVGDTKDAAEAVKKIMAFVQNHISKKDLSVGYASALEVAGSGQGDCTEHAVLTAALCRALGIPAEMVTGMVYVGSELLGKKNLFAPHAWNRVYLGGKWIDVDATRPEGFNAGYIGLAHGDGKPEEFFEMLSSLGQFKITSVSEKQ